MENYDEWSSSGYKTQRCVDFTTEIPDWHEAVPGARKRSRRKAHVVDMAESDVTIAPPNGLRISHHQRVQTFHHPRVLAAACSAGRSEGVAMPISGRADRQKSKDSIEQTPTYLVGEFGAANNGSRLLDMADDTAKSADVQL